MTWYSIWTRTQYCVCNHRVHHPPLHPFHQWPFCLYTKQGSDTYWFLIDWFDFFITLPLRLNASGQRGKTSQTHGSHMESAWLWVMKAMGLFLFLFYAHYAGRDCLTFSLVIPECGSGLAFHPPLLHIWLLEQSRVLLSHPPLLPWLVLLLPHAPRHQIPPISAHVVGYIWIHTLCRMYEFIGHQRYEFILFNLWIHIWRHFMWGAAVRSAAPIS